MGTLLGSVATVVASIASALKEPDESRSPTERDEQTRIGVELGVSLSRLQTLQRLFSAWATHDTVPWAKWMEFAAAPPAMPAAVHADAWLCASPMTAAQFLSRGLWKNVSAAVCTSATLAACGRFDFFDRLSGMNRFPERRAMVVASPFDYARQGELRIAPMSHSPKSPDFSEELCRTLPSLLTDRAVITVCDAHLVTTRYGRDILAGLPPFPVVRSKSVAPTKTDSGSGAGAPLT